MANGNDVSKQTAARLQWIDPTITTLELMDTAANPGRGGQPSRYADCTRS